MHVHPNQDAFADLVRTHPEGPVVMLNLLRFRDEADYSASPELAPESPISGAAAYKRYARHATPLLAEAGSEVLWAGVASATLIGPTDERWDHVLLVRHRSVADFIAFASNRPYLAGLGHRTAALADSRLVPVQETKGL